MIKLFLYTLAVSVVMFGCTKKENTTEVNPVNEMDAMTTPGKTFLNIGAHQQTLDYTCGPSAVLTLMKYMGKGGTELDIAAKMGTDSIHGTTPEQMTGWFNENGFKAAWHENGSLEMLRKNLKENKPTLVEWSDWGGHWVMVIGYDTRNTETTTDDVIYFADPYDRYDGNPDGVTSFNAERFYYMWYDALLFDRVMKRVYVEVSE